MTEQRTKERKGEKAEKYFWSKKRRIGVGMVEVGRRGRVAAVVIAFGSDSSTDIQLGGAGGGKATKKLGGGGGGVGGEGENQLGDMVGSSGDMCSKFKLPSISTG